MQIRRNTKTFKTILEIVTTCEDRADRQDLIRLYITRAGQSIADRIAIEGNKSEATFFYDLGYQALVNNLNSSNHQLYQSDDAPGIYFFHSTLSKAWDEAPFEFDVKIKAEFSSLPELPTTKEKGKEKDFVLPAQTAKAETGKAKPAKKSKEEAPKKATMFIDRGPKQPDYKLKYEIEFTDLDRIAFRNPQLTKKDVLDYYDKVSEYLLPYLKDRTHQVRPTKEIKETPSWVHNVSNDKDHLLFYAEHGALEFDVDHAKKNASGSPDYSIIVVDSGSEFAKAITVAQTAKEILDGLKLPAFVKTDGVSGLHIYLPLDASSTFEVSQSFSEYICKLIRLKAPDLVTLNGVDEYSYGKVTLDAGINEEGKGIVAPYSLVAGSAALVATPLSWDELEDGLRVEDFNYETIFDRLKKTGDPFEGFLKKKVNADEQVERLEENYSFLF
jgi:bifunctional non-homologous end joining protein LigD